MYITNRHPNGDSTRTFLNKHKLTNKDSVAEKLKKDYNFRAVQMKHYKIYHRQCVNSTRHEKGMDLLENTNERIGVEHVHIKLHGHQVHSLTSLGRNMSI